MSDSAITVENLGKRYTLGAQKNKTDGLRHALENTLKAPIRYFSKNKGEKKQTQDFWALKDVNFDIKQGEVVGIVGRNGAGKSTLLKVLSRITEPTTGRITTRGRIASLLEVGTGFHPELTGRENIFLNGAVLGMSRVETKRKFDEIVEFAEVSKFLDTPVKRYSSGMYVRLAFAVAAHLEPEILIVDEVLAVGDAEFQAKCLGKMEDVAHNGGRTVLFVSHNMAAVQNLCKKGILLNHGEVDYVGGITEVIENYGARAKQLASQDLNSRDDRTGKGDVKVTQIELIDDEMKVVKAAEAGRDLTIRVYYETKPGVIFNGDCHLDLSIERDTSVLFIVSTDFPRKDPLILKDKGYVDFKIPRLPLSEFTYKINTFIHGANVIQDWVVDAALLEVMGGDFFGTGRNCHKGWEGKYTLVNHDWSQSK